MTSMFVECREWYDKTYGNSYYSNRIWVDGEIVAVNIMTYGYGDAYVHAAIKTLHEMGYDAPSGSSEAKIMGVAFYTTKNRVLKKELWNANTYVPERKEIGDNK